MGRGRSVFLRAGKADQVSDALEKLAEALDAGVIAGAGIDTLEAEPPPPDHPLLHARNCLLTPHVGWATLEARRRLIAILAENIRGYLAGKPVNVVNP